jgi:hypothetical protein
MGLNVHYRATSGPVSLAMPRNAALNEQERHSVEMLKLFLEVKPHRLHSAKDLETLSPDELRKLLKLYRTALEAPERVGSFLRLWPWMIPVVNTLVAAWNPISGIARRSTKLYGRRR